MAGKIRRTIGVLTILTALLVSQIPVPTSVAAGSADFQTKDGTLIKYTGTANTVSVSDTIKVIGEEAFSGNQYLTNVSLGKNTKELAFSSFAKCPYLTKVSTSDALEVIDDFSFSGCSSLNKITIGPNVYKIGNGVFAGCDSLESIGIAKGNNEFVFDKGALYNEDRTVLYAYVNGCTNTVYDMPDTVEKISPYAFWGNDTLTTVYLSDSLQEISGYVFSNCKNLKTVAIPYSVKSIDAKAFENCLSLTDIEIPVPVSFIHATAFDGCYKLNIIAETGSYAYNYAQNLKLDEIEQSENEDLLAEIIVESTSDNDTDGTGDNYGLGVLKDASTDPSNVEYMPAKDPLLTPEDDSVLGKTIVVNGNAVLFIERDLTAVDGGTLIKDSNTDSSEVLEEEEQGVIYDSGKGGYLPKYAVLSNSIANQGYYGDKTLQDYTVPSGMVSIGDFSYARSSMTSVSIPDGVKTIGYGAFYHCDNLESVRIPGSVTYIDKAAFDKTPWLENWKKGSTEEFLIVGDGVLLAYRGSSNYVQLPDSVKTIAPACFADHVELQSVVLNDGVECIAQDAFAGCRNLKTVTGGNNLKKIEDRAFAQCPLTDFIVPDSVEEMGLRAIDFSEIEMEDSVICFAGKKLPMITFHDSATRLSRPEYRQDVLNDVNFAVVDKDCNSFADTVLDNDKLGFSGVVVTLEKDSNGTETGYAIIRDNGTLYKDTYDAMPQQFYLRGNLYKLKLDSELEWEDSEAEMKAATRKLTVICDGTTTQNITAELSQDEVVGSLYVDINKANAKMEQAYGALFGSNVPAMDTYSLTLMDVTDTLPIKKFGKGSLTVTVPLSDKIKGNLYHVICLDEDGQLEEVESLVNLESNTISFVTSHLSDFAVYATGEEQVTLSINGGKLVQNYRKDKSPDTGDNSLPIPYVVAVGMACAGLCLVFYKGKKYS